MERKCANKVQTSRPQKLPFLTESKSQLQTLISHLPEISSSTDRLKDLRKLYFQHKSNANILANSPYFTNRMQQKQIVSYISSSKHELDKRKSEEISAIFRMS